MSVRLHVWGDYACFTRPEMKVERYSYDVMTPSAARGILEAIYWHPGVEWKVHRISVCKPIQFTSVKRNEVKEKASIRNIENYQKNGGKLPILVTSDNIMQRSSTILKDVDYVIDASFILNRNKFIDGDSLTDAEVISIFNRRAQKGQYFHHPYFGTREFPVDFEWLNPDQPLPSSIHPIDMTHDLGFMLRDLDYSDVQHPIPLFFHAYLKHGVMDIPALTSEEVHR